MGLGFGAGLTLNIKTNLISHNPASGLERVERVRVSLGFVRASRAGNFCARTSNERVERVTLYFERIEHAVYESSGTSARLAARSLDSFPILLGTRTSGSFTR